MFGKKLSITDAQIQEALDPVKNAYSKKVIGGTAPEEVERQLKVTEKALIRDEALIAEHEAKLAAASEKLESQVEALVSKYRLISFSLSTHPKDGNLRGVSELGTKNG